MLKQNVQCISPTMQTQLYCAHKAVMKHFAKIQIISGQLTRTGRGPTEGND